MDLPYGAWLARMLQLVEAAVAAAEPLTSAHEGASEEHTARAEAAVLARTDALLELSHDLHAHPELAFEEHRSAAAVADLLEDHGHEVERGIGGLDTALRAQAGSGDGPVVALLAEYDALPEIGHGCGHNVIAATAVGAFLAAAEQVGTTGGRVLLLGTPAEEGGGGKEYLAQAGVFDDVDAALMLHPFAVDVADHPFLGARQVRATFTGLAAHAAAFAFAGRNALDAAVQAYQGMAQLRQHMLPTDRVHGVIREGGAKPNIVPDRAVLEFYVRSAELDTLAVLVEHTVRVMEGAAQQTGTEVQLDWDDRPPYVPTRLNQALSARWATNAARRGRKVLPRGVVPETLTGSTDLGNVSVRLPAIHPVMSIADGIVPIHTTAFAEAAVSELADRGVVDGAIGLAQTALDYLVDERLRRDVHEEFEAAGGRVDVASLFDGAGVERT